MASLSSQNDFFMINLQLALLNYLGSRYDCKYPMESSVRLFMPGGDSVTVSAVRLIFPLFRFLRPVR